MDLIDLSLRLIGECETLRKDRRAGKISSETYLEQMAGIAQSEKWANLIVKTFNSEERYNKPILAGRKLITSEPEKEQIPCPGCRNLITRAECLDWSGESPPRFEECEGCEHHVATRALLLPEKS